MSQRSVFRTGPTLVGLTVLVLLPSGAFGQDKPKPRADVAKGFAIEKPAHKLLAEASGAVPAAGKFVNPKVEPGLVKWHPSLIAAREAAGKSGKPVLLFQMMGKLDDQFC